MKGNYKKVPDTTKRIKFPKPRKEPNQYKEPIGPKRPSIGDRLRSFGAAISPLIAPAKRAGGRVRRYAARRSDAIEHNFGIGQFNPNMGAGLMDMRFPGSGFDEPATPQRKRRKSRKCCY